MDRKEIGNRIRELREERNLKQNALANLAGVSPTYIYQLERGEKSPTIEYLDHICWGLGITIQDFFAKPAEEDLTADKLSALNPDQKLLLNRFLNSLH